MKLESFLMALLLTLTIITTLHIGKQQNIMHEKLDYIRTQIEYIQPDYAVVIKDNQARLDKLEHSFEFWTNWLEQTGVYETKKYINGGH